MNNDLFRLEHKRRHGKVGKKRHLPKVNENWPVAEEWERHFKSDGKKSKP